MSYNPFREVKVIPRVDPGPVIRWSLDPAFDGLLPWKFKVEVSEVPTFSELLYYFEVENAFFAEDPVLRKQNWSRDTFYRVILKDGTGAQYVSLPAHLSSRAEDRRKYRMASEIVRKEALRIRKFVNTPGFLIKRKNQGAKALDVDPISGVPLADNVGEFGVNVAGGYHVPIKFPFSYEDGNFGRQLRPDGMGVGENIQINLRAIGFPPLDDRDILVDPHTNRRYSIEQHADYYFPGTDLVIVQTAIATLIPQTDTVYKISLPGD
jgi:hypothetical protein